MFYCDPCGAERSWPEGVRRSRGPCEMCGKTAVCSDVPSSALPDPTPPPRSCQATRYSSKSCTFDGPRWDVVYTLSNGAEHDRHPACFDHALAEVDRHHASNGMARCEMVEAPR